MHQNNKQFISKSVFPSLLNLIRKMNLFPQMKGHHTNAYTWRGWKITHHEKNAHFGRWRRRKNSTDLRCGSMTFSHGWKINLRLSCRVKSSCKVYVRIPKLLIIWRKIFNWKHALYIYTYIHMYIQNTFATLFTLLTRTVSLRNSSKITRNAHINCVMIFHAKIINVLNTW